MIIEIKRNPFGDTRTAPIKKSADEQYKEFVKGNSSHRSDVKLALEWLARDLRDIGSQHDHTKDSESIQFFMDFYRKLHSGPDEYDFTAGEWYQGHIRKERHHLNSHCPDNVNLLDVLEMIADCVVAGLARSGEVRDVEISSDILQKAVANTVEYIKGMCVIVSQ